MIGFMSVRRGDRVRRLLAESAVMDLYVVKVDEQLIYAALTDAIDPETQPGLVWTFDRATGIEEDEELDWGILKGRSGSRLVYVLPNERDMS